MAPRQARSLSEYAAEHTARSKKGECCRLVPPEMLAQIRRERAKDQPLSYTFLAEWLADHDIIVSPGSLRNHVMTGHPDG